MPLAFVRVWAVCWCSSIPRGYGQQAALQTGILQWVSVFCRHRWSLRSGCMSSLGCAYPASHPHCSAFVQEHRVRFPLRPGPRGGGCRVWSLLPAWRRAGLGDRWGWWAPSRGVTPPRAAFPLSPQQLLWLTCTHCACVQRDNLVLSVCALCWFIQALPSTKLPKWK